MQILCDHDDDDDDAVRIVEYIMILPDETFFIILNILCEFMQFIASGI